MSLTTDFLTDPVGFASRVPIGVDERGIKTTLAPGAGAGNHVLLTAANYILACTMEPYGGEALLTPHVGAHPGSFQAYFLPYEPDAAISMDVGAAADYFFTSTLTGCTVRVENRPGNVLRVTHGNGRKEYNRVFTVTTSQVAPDKDELRQADRMATAAAQGVINSLLPATAGGTCRTVTKRDYASQVTDGNMRAAKRRYRAPQGERVKRLEASRTNEKPEVSAFVFGVRHPVTGWTFWYQTTVQIVGELERGLIDKKTRSIYGESVVLGTPQQLYP